MTPLVQSEGSLHQRLKSRRNSTTRRHWISSGVGHREIWCPSARLLGFIRVY